MSSVFEKTPPPADRIVRYGEDPSQFAELRFPAADKPWPVIMNIHGGFWRARHDLAHAAPFCAGLTEVGFATCNVEYRRVGQPGGGWPGSLDDVHQAYSYFRKHSGELGFDTERMVVVGHSAGGHLAICLAAYEPLVARVVSLAGVLDLRQAYDLHLSNDAVVEFLQGTPQQVPEHYWKASPMNLKVGARQMIITGTADDVVPPDLSRRYVETKSAIGEQVELVEIVGANHFDLIDPGTEAFKTELQAIYKTSS